MTKIRQLREAARLCLASGNPTMGPTLFIIKTIVNMDDKEFRDFCRVISLGTEEDHTNV